MSARATHRTYAVMAALALGATAVLAWPATASADVTTHLGKASVSDSSASKVVTLSCPAGTVVLGGAAQAHEGSGAVHVTGWMPVPPHPGLKHPNSMVGYAAEAEGGYLGNWRAGVSVLCGPEPEGLEYVSAPSWRGSSASRSVTAYCPKTKRLVSAGARIATGDGEVFLTGVEPAVNLASVTVTAHEDATGFAGDWTVHAYAVCAYPLPEHQVVWSDGDSDSTGEKAVQALCPEGTELHGTGARLTGETGRVYLTRVAVLDDWVGSAVDGVEAAPGTTGDWSVRAYAVCAAD